MKKYLLLFLFWFLGLLFTQITYWVPALNPYSLDICSVIINPNSIDWYKIVSVSWFNWIISDVDSFACQNWYLFLVPYDMDVSIINTVKIEEKSKKNNDLEPWEINWAWWQQWFGFANFSNWNALSRKLNSEDSEYLWQVKNYCHHIDERTRCHHPNTHPYWIDFYKLWKNNKWEFGINRVFSMPYDSCVIIKLVLYFIWWIIVICWIAYIIKRIKSKKAK